MVKEIVDAQTEITGILETLKKDSRYANLIKDTQTSTTATQPAGVLVSTSLVPLYNIAKQPYTPAAYQEKARELYTALVSYNIINKKNIAIGQLETQLREAEQARETKTAERFTSDHSEVYALYRDFMTAIIQALGLTENQTLTVNGVPFNEYVEQFKNKAAFASTNAPSKLPGLTNFNSYFIPLADTLIAFMLPEKTFNEVRTMIEAAAAATNAKTPEEIAEANRLYTAAYVSYAQLPLPSGTVENTRADIDRNNLAAIKAVLDDKKQQDNNAAAATTAGASGSAMPMVNVLLSGKKPESAAKETSIIKSITETKNESDLKKLMDTLTGETITENITDAFITQMGKFETKERSIIKSITETKNEADLKKLMDTLAGENITENIISASITQMGKFEKAKVPSAAGQPTDDILKGIPDKLTPIIIPDSNLTQDTGSSSRPLNLYSGTNYDNRQMNVNSITSLAEKTADNSDKIQQNKILFENIVKFLKGKKYTDEQIKEGIQNSNGNINITKEISEILPRGIVTKTLGKNWGNQLNLSKKNPVVLSGGGRKTRRNRKSSKHTTRRQHSTS